MYSRKALFSVLTALAATVSGQDLPSLTDLIAGTPLLSELGSILGQYPAVAEALAGASDITILAPFNRAFADVSDALAELTQTDGAVEALLSYHVINGITEAGDFQPTPFFPRTLLTDEAFANVSGGQALLGYQPAQIPILQSGFKFESTVVQGDNFFDGGVVHIIDRVLTLPASASDTAAAAGLSALVGALTAAAIVDIVNTTPDVTIFAPSNAAFEAIGSAVGELTTEQLTTILSYHVSEGFVAFSPDLQILPRNLATLAGTNLSVTNSGTPGAEDVFVNGAQVIATNFIVANGVVHVIDAVLNPDNAGNTAPGVQFEGASSAPLGALTSGVPAPSASYPALTSAFVGASSSVAASASSSGPVMATGAAPIQTAMVGLGALFGGAAVMANM